MITFKNITVATVNSRGKFIILENADVKIKDNIIAEVGKNLKAEGEIIEGDYLLTPGFVNAHIHPTGVLSKGLSDRLDWKELSVKLNEIKFGISDDERTLASIQCFIECAKGGATTCLSASSTLEEVFYASNITGMRTHAFGMPKDIWSGGGKARTFDTGKIKEMFKKWSQYNGGLFSSNYGIASLRAASDSLIGLVIDSAVKNRKMFKIHIAQSRIDMETTQKDRHAREVEYVCKNFGEILAKLGNRSFFVHSALVNDAEVKQIKKIGANVVICAGAMAKIGTGFAPLKEYLQGINTLLGTDLSLNNDSNNILAEAQFVALAYKAKEESAGFMNSEDVFKMLTSNAEKAGLGKIGKVEKGYLADINVFDLNTYPFAPSHDYLNNLIFNGFNARPMHVLINGRFVLKDYCCILDWNNAILKKNGIGSERDLVKAVRGFVRK